MLYRRCVAAGLVFVGVNNPLHAADKSPVAEALAREVVSPRQALLDAQAYVDARLPRMPKVSTVAEWETIAKKMRADVLHNVVFRGAAAKWRGLKTNVEWLDSSPGGAGYRIKKLRYEAVPGMWIPALLYEPDKLSSAAPVCLAVNGHERTGKATDYKQIRCINMAKRGMIVLNLEWFNMGQLRTEGYVHYKLNELDLCGTSGLAPFYLSMSRGLDILLSLPKADPARVSVSGLSGGGWQTIFISSLDTRVTLSNPVAGYSSYRTRLAKAKDLGDSEQTPVDLGKYADYDHLTALLAPRPALLTYNAKDNCCFEAGYALPPLLEAAEPIYKLYGREKNLSSHVNHDPGDHNFGKDNRQAFYRMLGAHWYPGDKSFNADEIPAEAELKKAEELFVPLPEKNADFNTLARDLMKDLPRNGALPGTRDAFRTWQREQHEKIVVVVKPTHFTVKATRVGSEDKDGLKTGYWQLRLGDAWSVPVVELSRGSPTKTAVLLNDAGRKVEAANAERLLRDGYRVLAADLWYFGECRPVSDAFKNDFLMAMMLDTVGIRPIGLQASQLAAVSRWAQAEFKAPVNVVAGGPRQSLIALVAAVLEDKTIKGLELHGALGSMKEIIEKGAGVDRAPEQFCFGLLEAVDVKQLVALAAPRPVRFVKPSDRVKAELAELTAIYKLLGREFDPLR